MDQRCTGEIVVDQSWICPYAPQTEPQEEEIGAVHEDQRYDLLGCNMVYRLQPCPVLECCIVDFLEGPSFPLVDEERMIGGA